MSILNGSASSIAPPTPAHHSAMNHKVLLSREPLRRSKRGSVIVMFAMAHLASKDPITKRRVSVDHGQDHRRADEREFLARMRRREFPERYAGEDGVGRNARHQAAITEQHERQRHHERPRFVP